MSMEVNTLSIPLGDPGAADTLMLMQAPSDVNGGGLRVLSASAVNGAATSGGTTFSLRLLRYSAAGTPAVNGTIAVAIGGTADEWADNVPKNFVIDPDHAFLDAGEWLVADYAEQNSGNPTRGYLTVNYVNGK